MVYCNSLAQSELKPGLSEIDTNGLSHEVASETKFNAKYT